MIIRETWVGVDEVRQTRRACADDAFPSAGMSRPPSGLRGEREPHPARVHRGVVVPPSRAGWRTAVAAVSSGVGSVDG